MISSLALTLASLGFFFLCGAVFIAVLITTWVTIHNYRTHTQLAEERLRILASLSELDRYCSSEFPIVEDLTRWLHMQIAQEEDAIDVRTFRAQLREKYVIQAETRALPYKNSSSGKHAL
jgi:hypothetical protein